MRDKARGIFRNVFAFVNLVVVILYLLVCLVPYLDTGKFWFIAFPGLAFPLLFFALFCFIIFWAIAKSRWFWISLVVMLLGAQQIFAVFAFHLPSSFELAKEPTTLRIFHWNVEGWDSYYEGKRSRERSDYPQMMQLIKEQNADILCFEEYADINDINDSNSTVTTIKKMGYPYLSFAETEQDSRQNRKGVIIFSRTPILKSGTIMYSKPSNAEHLIYVDIRRGQKMFRIFTTHLQSVRFEHSDYASLSKLKHAKDPGIKDSRTIASKLKRGYEFRYSQAQTVRKEIEASPYPAIITGDFNDVPNSNTYFEIKGNFHDAFLEKGSFIGRTFRFISPTLRIDYILADKSFKVKQFRVVHVPYSDHYPIETDLQY